MQRGHSVNVQSRISGTARHAQSGGRTNMNTPPSSGDMELTSFTYGYRVPNMGTFGATLDTR